MTIVATTEQDSIFAGRVIEIDNDKGTITALTANEQMYVEQGYALPEGWTWGEVHRMRELFTIREIDVPLVSAGNVIAWGVPFSNGKPLRHL